MNTPSTSVSPGLGGFLAFFLLAIALWLLMRNMNARLRRMSYRDEAESTKGASPTAPQAGSPAGQSPEPGPSERPDDAAGGEPDGSSGQPRAHRHEDDEDGPRPPAQG